MLGMLGSSECCMPEALPRIGITVRIVKQIVLTVAIAIRATTLPVTMTNKGNSKVTQAYLVVSVAARAGITTDP